MTAPSTTAAPPPVYPTADAEPPVIRDVPSSMARLVLLAYRCRGRLLGDPAAPVTAQEIELVLRQPGGQLLDARGADGVCRGWLLLERRDDHAQVLEVATRLDRCESDRDLAARELLRATCAMATTAGLRVVRADLPVADGKPVGWPLWASLAFRPRFGDGQGYRTLDGQTRAVIEWHAPAGS